MSPIAKDFDSSSHGDYCCVCQGHAKSSKVNILENMLAPFGMLVIFFPHQDEAKFKDCQQDWYLDGYEPKINVAESNFAGYVHAYVKVDLQ